jgi:hypothetical protein
LCGAAMRESAAAAAAAALRQQAAPASGGLRKRRSLYARAARRIAKEDSKDAKVRGSAGAVGKVYV